MCPFFFFLLECVCWERMLLKLFLCMRFKDETHHWLGQYESENLKTQMTVQCCIICILLKYMKRIKFTFCSILRFYVQRDVVVVLVRHHVSILPNFHNNDCVGNFIKGMAGFISQEDKCSIFSSSLKSLLRPVISLLQDKNQKQRESRDELMSGQDSRMDINQTDSILGTHSADTLAQLWMINFVEKCVTLK